MICNLMVSCGIVIMDCSPVTVTVDCGSALDHNGLAARTSLVTGPRWACDDTVNTV